MRRSLRIIPALALIGAGPAFSQTPATQDESIVVTGESPAQARRQAQSYVRELGVATGERPTARWLDPVCPRAVGLSSAHAALVEAQLRRIISEVGAPLANEKCTGNFLIAFTDGAGTMVRHITSKDPGATSELRTSQVRELKHGAAPVRWWYNTQPRTSDGAPLAPVLPPSVALDGVNIAYFPSSSGVLSQYGSSLASTQAVRAIYSVNVVVDVGHAEGVPLQSVIDYAALVGLAEIKLGASPEGSILSLFSQGERQLTRRDRAFLSALYQIRMDRRAEQQRRALIGKIANPSAAN